MKYPVSRGYTLEKHLEASGRVKSSSNFIFKAGESA